MHLHVAWWFAAGLSIGLTAGWMPWGRLMRYCARPAVQAFTWPACGALIVLLSALSVPVWRTHADPGDARVAGTSNGFGSTGMPMAASTHPVAANASAHETPDLDLMLGKLERRLRGGSVDPNDWELLAQTYAYLGRADDARNAREHHLVAAAAMLADADNQAPQILGARDADSADSAVSSDSANVVPRRGGNSIGADQQ